MANWWDKYEAAAPAKSGGNWWDKYEKPSLAGKRASGRAGVAPDELGRNTIAPDPGRLADPPSEQDIANSERGRFPGRIGEFWRQTEELNKRGLRRGEFDLGTTLDAALGGAEEQTGGLVEAAGDALKPLQQMYNVGAGILSGDVAGADDETALTEAGRGIAETGRIRSEFARRAMIERPKTALSVDALKWLGQEALASGAPTALGLAAGVASPRLGLGAIGASAAGSEYSQSKAEGQGALSAAGDAAFKALSEAAPEAIPLGVLARTLGKPAARLGSKTLQRLYDNPVGRQALMAGAEGSSEVMTEMANIGYERAVEGKDISDDDALRRITDAFAVGATMGGAMGGAAEVANQTFGQAAQDRSLRSAIRPMSDTARAIRDRMDFDPQIQRDLAQQQQARATTERILGGSLQSPKDLQTATGAALAEDAIAEARAARPVNRPTMLDSSPVAPADMTEDAELDTLLAGLRGPDENTALGDVGQTAADETGPANERVGTAKSASGTLDLPNGTYFIPGDPAAIRQRLADAGVEWRGKVRTVDGQQGVRFGKNTREQVLGVLGGVREPVSVSGGSDARGAAMRPEFQNLRGNQGTSGVQPESEGADVIPSDSGLSGDVRGRVRQPDVLSGGGIAGGLGESASDVRGVSVPTQAEAAVDVPPALRGLTPRELSAFASLENEINEATSVKGGTALVDENSQVTHRLGWTPMAPGRDFWRGRPTNWTANKARTALRKAQSGEKLTEQEQNIVDYARKWSVEYAKEIQAEDEGSRSDSILAQREADRGDIETAMASVADNSPEQRASARSLGSDYTPRLLQLLRDRRAWGLNPQQEQEYQDLLELDRETTKVHGRPILGVRNMTAYVDALDSGKLLPVQGFTDADNFKSLNDRLGHAAGDDAIRIIGETLVETFGEGNVFHRGGDEFLFQSQDQDELVAKIEQAKRRLSELHLTAVDKDGNTEEQWGIGLSYGYGATEAEADEALKRDKAARKQAGLRRDRADEDRRIADRRGVGSEPVGEGVRSGEGDGRVQGQAAAAEGVDANAPVSGTLGRKLEESVGSGGNRGRVPNRASDAGRTEEGAGTGASDVREGASRPIRGADGIAEGRGDNAGTRAATDGAQVEATGLTLPAFRAELAESLGSKFARRLESQPWFNLVASVDALPADVRKSITDADTAAGFVLPDGRVFVIAGNIPNGQAAGVTLHEVGVHFGMSGLPDFPAILAQFKRLRARDGRVGAAYERAESVAERAENGDLTESAKALLDEEALAYFIEENWNAKHPLMTRILDAVVRLLNRLGIPMSTLADKATTRNVLRGMIDKAREAANDAAAGRITVKNGKLAYHKAWHGSPHDFDKFRLDDSTIGTGEGAQAYGHGLYFSGTREVADWYRRNLARLDFNPEKTKVRGKTVGQWYESLARDAERARGELLSEINAKRGMVEQVMLRRSPDAVLGDAIEDGVNEAAVKWFRETFSPYFEKIGRTYEVELAPDESDYLDWDKPLSEQSEKVRKALEEAALSKPFGKIRAGHANNLRDITQTSAFIKKGFGGLDAPSQRVVLDGMREMVNDSKILDAVVGLVPVDVMDIFRGKKSAPDGIFDDPAVFLRLFAGKRNDGVSLGVDAASSAVRGIADAAFAEEFGVGGDVVGVPKNTIAAVRAGAFDQRSGSDIYRAISSELGSDKSASDYLTKIGVSGIRYLDGSSRGKGEGSHNYVIFDDSLVEVKAKYSRRTPQQAARWDSTKDAAQEAADLTRRARLLEQAVTLEKRAIGTEADKRERIRKHGEEAKRLIAEFDKLDALSIEKADAQVDLRGLRTKAARGDRQAIRDLEQAVLQRKQIEDEIAEAKSAGGRAAQLLNAIDRTKLNDVAPMISALQKFSKALEIVDRAVEKARKRRDWWKAREKAYFDAVEGAEKKRESLAAEVGAGAPGKTFVQKDRFTDDWRGTLRKAREKVQDKLLSVRDVQEDVEKVRGAVEDAMNVYRRENLMHGRVGQQRDQFERTHIKPLIEAMQRDKVSVELFEDYLEARHAEERNKSIAAKNQGMPDAGAGLTTQAAADFLAGNAAGHRSGATLAPDMVRKLDRLASRVDAITAETRKRMLDSGLITQQEYNTLQNGYQFYVPLRGKDGQENAARGGTGKGIDSRGKMIQRALGRGDGNRAENILAEIIGDAERSIIRAEKARVGRTLARLVIENPNPDVWSIEPVKVEQAYSESADEIYLSVQNLDQDPNTIIVKSKGKPYRIYIEDTRIAEALKNLSSEQLPLAIQMMGGLNRYFSAVLTRYNPAFVAVNMTRDMLFGMTGLYAEHGIKEAGKAAANYLPAMRAMWREARGTLGNGRMDQYAKEFAEAGAKTYFGKLENVQDIAQRIGLEFKSARKIAMEGRPLAAVGKMARDSRIVQAIEHTNDAVENALRLAAYAARREAGASVEQAAEYAKNLTVNFNRRGSATSWLNALYLFFNASVQGSHRVFKLLKNRKVQGVLAGLAALQAMSAMMLLSYDDEDGEPLWDSIPDWEKQRNLIFAYPYIGADGKIKATTFKLPMPYGFNVFTYQGGRIASLVNDLRSDKKHAVRDYINDSVATTLSSMAPLPFGEEGGWKALQPHWLRLTGMLSENRDDLGIPIRQGDEYDRYDRPRAAKGRDDTSEVFKMAARGLNWIGGGDDYNKPMMPWLLDWAPEDLEFIVATAAGGLGSTALKGERGIEKAISGVGVSFKDVPILSSFVSNVDQRQATANRYYEHKDEIERQVAQQRDIAKESGSVGDNKLGIRIARNASGAKIKRGDGFQLEGSRGSLFATYKQAEKDLERIRDDMRATYRDQSLSMTERARKIDALKNEREETQRELNAKWREVFSQRSQAAAAR